MNIRTVVFAGIACLLSVPLLAQPGGAGSGSQSPSSSTPSASQGSATIENQIIAYALLRKMAGQIADRAAAKCPPTSCGNVLLTDPNAQMEIISANSFDASVKALIGAYRSLVPGTVTSQAASDYLSAAGTLITALRSTATYTNQNFQPTTQSMINLLNVAMNKDALSLWSSTNPGDLATGQAGVNSAIESIAKAQNDVKDPKARADVDKEFSAFRTSLTAASPDGTLLATIIKGKTLLASLGSSYVMLTVSVDAAGGDTKVTHFVWQELIMPTPSPSYNGGAIISFLVTDAKGKFQDGGMVYDMRGWSKWKNPKFVWP